MLFSIVSNMKRDGLSVLFLKDKALNMRILFLSVFTFLASLFAGYGQSLKQVVEAGDESFQNRDYYNAYRCYETVLKFASKGAYKGDTLKVKFDYARAAQRLNYFSKARDLYDELSREAGSVNKDIHARSFFYLARMLQNLAQDSTHLYSQALNTYQYFLNEELFRDIEDSPAIQARFERDARAGMESCNEFGDATAVRTDSLYRLPMPINSEFSEVGPVRVGNTLYFSSLRFLPPGINTPRQSSFFSKQLMSTFRQGTVLEPEGEVMDSFLVMPVSENFNADRLHTLHTAFSQDGSLMFFTLCAQEKGDLDCSIYRRRRLADGSWDVPHRLSINAENKEFTATQPSTAFDCTSGKEWLYFSSDRPGGHGGMDIWRAEIMEGGTLGVPENLPDKINTEKDEATPFFHSLSQRLYFSSDASPSFGEFDIFYSDLRDGAWSVPQNMGLPYNSGYNDQYFFLTADGQQEYFTSDRPRSFRFVEELEFCCTDIYTMANEVDRTLEVSLEDCDETQQLEKVVELYELSCGERNRVGLPQTVFGKGSASFPVQLYREYEMKVYSPETDLSYARKFNLSEEQYFNNTSTISWKPDPFYPTRLDLKVIAYDESTGEPLDGALIQVREKEVERQVAGGAGNVFPVEPDIEYTVHVEMDPSQPGMDYTAQRAGDPAQPSARVQNYQAVNLPYHYTTSDPDNMRRLCGKDTLRIFMKPVPPELPLPIVLYFDHDRPTRYQGRPDRTDQSFDEAIQLYLDRKSLFLEKNDPSESRRVDAFFEREVSGGLTTLQNLASSLMGYVDYMGEDEKLVIEIQGYCSPRGGTEYNQKLSERRIQCVRTFLESYSQDGRQLKDFVGTKFIVEELPLGESQASSTYPDNDPNSIWGIGPALDRRVEIVDLTKGKGPKPTQPQLDDAVTQDHEP